MDCSHSYQTSRVGRSVEKGHGLSLKYTNCCSHRIDMSCRITVQICMELRSQQSGYAALKILHAHGQLSFNLRYETRSCSKFQTEHIPHRSLVEQIIQVSPDYCDSDSTERNAAVVCRCALHLSKADYFDTPSALHRLPLKRRDISTGHHSLSPRKSVKDHTIPFRQCSQFTSPRLCDIVQGRHHNRPAKPLS